MDILDEIIEDIPQAEANDTKATWEYGEKLNLKGGPIGKEHKKIHYAKGSPYAI